MSEHKNVDEDICAIGHGSRVVEVDLVQPLDPDKEPAVHTPPLNHVGLWVERSDQRRAVADCAGRAPCTGWRCQGAAGYDICFVHLEGSEEFHLGARGGC